MGFWATVPTLLLNSAAGWEGTSTQDTEKAKPQSWEGENQPLTSSLASSTGGLALSSLVPSAVLLSLLAAAGSAGLLCSLHRRREGNNAHTCAIPYTTQYLSRTWGIKTRSGHKAVGAPTSQ